MRMKSGASVLAVTMLLVEQFAAAALNVADYGYVLENGKIAGMGTTDQFMRAQSDRSVAAEIVRNAAAAQAGRELPPSAQPPSAQSTSTQVDPSKTAG
jgi:ABC-type sulfate/molybdate transport systems ATPase subunit